MVWLLIIYSMYVYTCMWLPIGHGKVLKTAHSFPEYKEAMKTTHLQPSLKDVKGKLLYDEIPEESTVPSSKVGGS